MLRVEAGGKSKNPIGDSGLLNVSCHGASMATPAALLAGVEETNCRDEKSGDAAVVKVELVGAVSLPWSSMNASVWMRYCVLGNSAGERRTVLVFDREVVSTTRSFWKSRT